MTPLSQDRTDKSILKHYNRLMEPLDQAHKDKKFADQSSSAPSAPTRVRVARVDDKIFIDPAKSKRKPLKKAVKVLNYREWHWSTFVFLGFLFVAILRLIFMEHGIVNFNEKQQILNERNELIGQLKVENQDLNKEIKRANEDVKYQKNLAREQLGVISPEEYLILFAPKK